MQAYLDNPIYLVAKVVGDLVKSGRWRREYVPEL